MIFWDLIKQNDVMIIIILSLLQKFIGQIATYEINKILQIAYFFFINT